MGEGIDADNESVHLTTSVRINFLIPYQFFDTAYKKIDTAYQKIDTNRSGQMNRLIVDLHSFKNKKK